jgi:hypothetical protein
MPRGGKRSTSFKPGVSGNPSGRPKRPRTIEARRIVADVRALARECAPDAIATLKTITLNAKTPPAARIGAATAILDRGYGRPWQAIDVWAKPWAYHKLTDEQLHQFEQLLMIVKPDGEGENATDSESASKDWQGPARLGWAKPLAD